MVVGRNDRLDGYEVAVFPEECGFVNNQWWHKHLERTFKNPIDALIVAEDIIGALIKGTDCPCGEKCAFNVVPGVDMEYPRIFEEKSQEEIHLD